MFIAMRGPNMMQCILFEKNDSYKRNIGHVYS